ncbi:hypothetical protein [Rhizobium sp. 007]|uniref:hypothetical protein n=1 Tax=Rhizobium sp. 007 TaxID=2785056 RepID=UPI00188F51F6|nr:hypothetical protein [Rhizobium sp. 007]QPB22159.1 hypothetical protein ISN39_00805 [Rhizobium sp. 007]
MDMILVRIFRFFSSVRMENTRFLRPSACPVFWKINGSKLGIELRHVRNDLVRLDVRVMQPAEKKPSSSAA